jgi:hypothetical protein
MIKVKAAEKVYQVPTSWADITFEKYCQVVAHEDKGIIERLETISSIPAEVLNQLPFSSLTSLIDVVAFSDKPEAAYAFADVYENKDFSIGKESYDKVEEARMLLSKAEKPILAAAGIVKIYTGEDISQQPLTACLAKAGFFLAACQHFLNATNA